MPNILSKKISILGSTGSIGTSTLDIVRLHPDRFKVVGLAAGSNIDLLIKQIKEFSPRLVSVQSKDHFLALREKIGPKNLEILKGSEGSQAVASMDEVDLVVSGIVGAAGLLPTLAALEKGKTVGLANKESMIIAGELMNRTRQTHGATILPIDSEHSALFQCLQGQRREDLKRLILTASGGPFFHKPLGEFGQITVDDALKHPNWDMGAKITIDSATMMNKGLEVMEARWLFDVPVDQVDVCVHPQSIVHSMVEYQDGSVIAQMGLPDMKVPIAYALSYPERIKTGVKSLQLSKIKELTFFDPDFEKFPCLKLAFEVARKGRTYPAVLNAANEIAVQAFLEEEISFNEIYKIVSETVECHSPFDLGSLDDVLKADHWAREMAKKQSSTFKVQSSMVG